MAPVIFYTLIAGLSLCVGGADALSILRVTVPTSVITGACYAAFVMKTIVSPTATVTFVSSHTLYTLALPLLIT